MSDNIDLQREATKRKEGMSHENAFHILFLRLPRPSRLLRKWRHNFISRAHLAALPVDRLQDIGVTPAMRDKEVARPFWD